MRWPDWSKSEDPWPHYWCSHQSALVVGSGMNSVQAGCLGVQSSPWWCTALPRSTDLCWWLARTMTTLLYQYQPPHGTASQTVNSRQQSLCHCICAHLEQTANWHHCGKFTVNLSSTTETFFISAMISWHHLLTSSHQWSLQWLCHLGQFKNNWLIDWLKTSVY